MKNSERYAEIKAQLLRIEEAARDMRQDIDRGCYVFGCAGISYPHDRLKTLIAQEEKERNGNG